MKPVDDSIGLHAQLACIWEATARKPGNVDPFHDFADSGYIDFLTSAAAIAPVMAAAPGRTLGATVLDAVRRTREVARGNTNLGIILLLAPLSAVEPGQDYRSAVEARLARATIDDAAAVYSAIRLALPGGLGQVAQQDVSSAPTVSLREAMALAADRDLIARQYANGFSELFETAVPAVLAGIERIGCMEGAIIHAQLHLLSLLPDTLIARKRGKSEAEEAGRRAAAVLESGWPRTQASRSALAAFDDWLREEGHQRNPGTTADLIAASLFVLLRQRRVEIPLTIPWALDAPDVID